MKLIAAVALTVLCAGAWAGNVWQKDMEVVQAMSEHDTRARLRESALQKMRVLAAAEAGKLVESVRTLNNETLTEEIREIGVALVRISNVRESAAVDTKGVLTISVRALITVDEGELSRRADAIQKDRSKAMAVHRLTEENRILREAMSSMEASLGVSSSSGGAVHRYAQLLRTLQENHVLIENTFTQGALLGLADEGSAQVELAVSQVEEMLFERIMQAPVMARIEHVAGAGDEVTLLIRLGWSVNIGQLQSDVSKYLSSTKVGDEHTALQIPFKSNADGASKSRISKLVVERLARKRLVLELSLGASKVEVPVVFVGSELWDSRHCYKPVPDGMKSRTENTSLCVIGNPAGEREILSLPAAKRSNPVRMHVARDEAGKASSLQARWILSVEANDGSRVNERVVQAQI